MPTGRHLSNNTKAVLTLGALVAIVLGVLVSLGVFDEKREPSTSTSTPTDTYTYIEPTDTVEVGALDFYQATEGGQEEGFLVQHGEVRTALIFDEHSYCNPGHGGIQCMAMSSMYSMPFGGKRAIIEGNKEGDAIRVRMLRIVDEDVPPLVRGAGNVYIPWMHARTLILECKVTSLMQSHSGVVDIELKEGTKLVALQPVMDEVFKVATESTAACGNVQLGTE